MPSNPLRTLLTRWRLPDALAVRLLHDVTPERLALLQEVDRLVMAVYGDPGWLHRHSGGTLFGKRTPAQMMAAEGDSAIEAVARHLRMLERGHRLAVGGKKARE